MSNMGSRRSSKPYYSLWKKSLDYVWLQHIRLDRGEIKMLTSRPEGSLDYLLEKYSALFFAGLGTIKMFPARLHIDHSATQDSLSLGC